MTLFPGILSSQQETGIILGKVLDEQNSPLPGVAIAITSPNLMGTRSLASDRSGNYRFPALPPGTYTIDATLEGFTPAKKTNVELHVGVTVTVDIVLQPTKLAEEVTVVATAPLIDLTDASLAKTTITRDFIENIPTARDTSLILLFTPGVIGTSNYASSYGSGVYSNGFQIDGVELNDAWCGSGVYSTPIDYDAVQEAQVIGLGASAEYGEFTGAMVRIVTRSGGNKFEGSAQVYYRNMKWTSENIPRGDPKWSLLPEALKVRSTDPSFQLGGPIIKDKLWFFASFQYFDSRTYMTSIDRSSFLTFPKYFLKLTFQPDERNRFQGFFSYHKRHSKGSLSRFTAPEAQGQLIYPVFMGNLSFLHTFSPDTLLELKGAGYSIVWDSIPLTGNKTTSGHSDLVSGISTVNLYFWSRWKSSRVTASGTLSHYAENLLKGSHDFKFGFEYQRVSGGGDVTANGGFYYQDYNGAPYRALTYENHQWADYNRFTVYAQDDWKIMESFVVNPGFRYNVYRGSVPGLGTVYKPTGFEPRIGFSWDVFKDHKTAFKAHYGKYFESTKTYYISRMKASIPDTIYYWVPQWGTLVEDYRIKNVNLYSIDPNIKHPSMDEFTAGIERVLGKDLSLSASFIYRVWGNFVEPVNVGCNFSPRSYADPGTGQVYTIYNNLNPAGAHYYITNPTKGKDIGAAYPDIVARTPEIKYRALEISLTKRMSNNWQLFTSYVYAKQEGDLLSSVGQSSIYFDPNSQINFYGTPTYNIPHTIKIQGTFILPFDFILSGYFTFYNGFTWQRNITVTGLSQGAVTIRTEPTGARRLPDTQNLDLRLEKSFNINNYRFRFMLDAFNVFNRGVETSIYGTAYSGAIALANFGKPTGASAPRSLRLGFKFMF